MDSKLETALKVIRHILEDDVNYPAASLKLGGIWHACQSVAEFKYSKSEHIVEVKAK